MNNSKGEQTKQTIPVYLNDEYRDYRKTIFAISITSIICLLLGIFLFDSMFESLLWKILSVACLGSLLIFVESIIAVRIYPKVR